MRRATEFLRRPSCPEDGAGATSVPIWQTATFAVEEGSVYDYSRSGNPTRRALEGRIAALELGESCAAFASGMAAIAAVLALVPCSGRVLVSPGLYGGTLRLLEAQRRERDLRVEHVEMTASGLREALERPADLILVETPGNPSQDVVDLRLVAELARERRTLLVVDNSMLSPWLQNPLTLGADLVLHSATKFLSGHGDLTAGVVVGQDPELMARIRFHQNAVGSALAPFESWLLLRGIDTLALRVEKQQANAAEVATALRESARVAAVSWLGFADHPGHAIQMGQARGPGSVLAFDLGDHDRARAFLRRSRLCSVVVSFGSLRSTISQPATMSHASVPESMRARLAPKPGLIRLSVGIEDAQDLIEDLLQAIG